MPRSRTQVLTFLVWLLFSRSLFGQEAAVVKIDMTNLTQDPTFPIVNIKAASSVVIEIQPISTLWRLRPTGAEEGAYASGSRIVLNFTEMPEPTKAPVVDRSSWTIFVHDRKVINLDVDIDPSASDADVASLKASLNATARQKARGEFVIQLERATYALAWSAGLSFLGLRDQRFRLEPIEGNDQEVSLIRTKDDDIPYRLVALAHYCSVRNRAICPTFGFGFDVPVTGLTAIAGIGFRFRPIIIKDSMYLTLGAAYGPRKVLNSDFEGHERVPSGTGTDTLRAQRYDVSWMISFSFGFFGGEEEFKAVYEGKRPKGGS